MNKIIKNEEGYDSFLVNLVIAHTIQGKSQVRMEN